jgi:hypothetical protein
MHKDTKYAKMWANKNFMHDMKELETWNKMTEIIMLHIVLNKLKIIKKKNTFYTFPKWACFYFASKDALGDAYWCHQNNIS